MGVSLVQRTTGLGQISANWTPVAPTTFAPGDRIFILNLSNGSSAQPLVSNPGALWHVLGYVKGNLLVDPQRITVYGAEVPESGLITMPQMGPGNRNMYTVLVMRKNSGNSWRDALGGAVPWVLGADDPASAVPLSGSPGPYSGYEPQSGDAIVAFGGFGTSNSGTPTSLITMPGVSGGAVSNDHRNTGTGSDGTMETSVWTDVVVNDALVEDAHITVSYTYGAGAQYGVVGAFPVRQTTLTPGPPTSLTETHDGVSIDLGWSAPISGAPPTSYEVRLNGGSATDVGLVLTHSFTGLTGETLYDVEVRAKNAEGVSIWVGLYNIMTSAGWPDNVLNLDETHTTTTITVTWDPPTTGPDVDGYYVRIDEGTPFSVGSLTEHLFTGLSADTVYTIEVQPYNEVGEGDWSSIIARTSPVPPPRITWDDPNSRYYHTGVDRGVLYLPNDAIPWNGITGATENGGGAASVLYRDGVIYFADVEASDFSGNVTAFFWPDKFSKCLGMPEIAPGFSIDNQRPTPFGLSYRSLIGSGTEGDMFGYQIHLIYNAVASIGSRQRKTLTDTPEIMEFSFDIVCTPIKVPGFRPAAHFIIDTRNLDPAALVTLEDLLYGDGEVAAHLPRPDELYDILNFGSAITFVDHGDGTWTATGSSQNLVDNGDGTISIFNVNGTDNGDGTYILEDTP